MTVTGNIAATGVKTDNFTMQTVILGTYNNQQAQTLKLSLMMTETSEQTQHLHLIKTYR